MKLQAEMTNKEVRYFDLEKLYENDTTVSIDALLDMVFATSCKPIPKIYFNNLNLEGSILTRRIYELGFSPVLNVDAVKSGKSFQKIQSLENLYEIVVRKGSKKIRIINSFTKLSHTSQEADEVIGLGDTLLSTCALHNEFMNNGASQETVSSNAMHSYKSITFGGSNEEFRTVFPVIKQAPYTELQNAYRGGWNYLNPKYQGVSVSGNVYDINSMYPSIMKNELLPVGQVKRLLAGRQATKPLYVRMVEVTNITLKEGKFPFLERWATYNYILDRRVELEPRRLGKKEPYFEFLVGMEGIETNLFYLTNMEFDLMMETYDVEGLKLGPGFEFEGAVGHFDDYIDYWYDKKSNAETKAERQYAKLMLNGLYGKFGTKTNRDIFKVEMKEDTEVKVNIGKQATAGEHNRAVQYLPIAIFTTAYGRTKLVRHANENADNFIYADTDSLHVKGEAVGLDIDSSALGAWKHEMSFTECKFLDLKCYAEFDGQWNFTVAGLSTADELTIEEFYVGNKVIDVKPRVVATGVELTKTYFTLASKL